MGALSAWFMTSGEAGFRTQARGLAMAVAGEARELVVGLKPPWRALPGAWAAPFALANLSRESDRPTPPWPDLLISCGRRTTALSIAIRRASRGRTVTVHVQNPLTAVSAFDLVIAMEHDQVSGPNVISAPTALHDVTPDRLAAAGEAWRARLARPGRPLIGVMLGGTTRHHPFETAEAQVLIDRLQAVRRATGAALAVTPSRRTPVAARALFEEALAGDPDAYLWDLQGDNPYRGILALSDRLVVTSDSVSMISEALATPHPVEVFGPDGGRRHAAFLHGLLAKGLVRRFLGDPVPPPAGGPIDATEAAAAAVRSLLQARRTGVG
ncbi:mitochondrial fission ELM1 family protein [Phenylobacterium montanum]|uniref:Mitochondrial fission ELM1 family protein n=1 Tax=Phenylobacterium montanum TaxID=2823693 RepID=A0A975FXY9_9CAUL|nr:mitochondrial fission ELM1 family protein [Caulobacter sp. S6]QUD87216.1 mitochondrial fission ELM1 family protein [Caulobacter sp. S6]